MAHLYRPTCPVHSISTSCSLFITYFRFDSINIKANCISHVRSGSSIFHVRSLSVSPYNYILSWWSSLHTQVNMDTDKYNLLSKSKTEHFRAPCVGLILMVNKMFWCCRHAPFRRSQEEKKKPKRVFIFFSNFSLKQHILSVCISASDISIFSNVIVRVVCVDPFK